MRSRLYFSLILLLMIVSPWSRAVEIEVPLSSNVQWRCWYDQGTFISCLLTAVPAPGRAYPISLNLPSNAPTIVRVLRYRPEVFSKRFIHIPLFTQPFDAESAAYLAKAAVCGSRKDCSVDFSMRPLPFREINALLARDPVDKSNPVSSQPAAAYQSSH